MDSEMTYFETGAYRLQDRSGDLLGEKLPNRFWQERCFQ